MPAASVVIPALVAIPLPSPASSTSSYVACLFYQLALLPRVAVGSVLVSPPCNYQFVLALRVDTSLILKPSGKYQRCPLPSGLPVTVAVVVLVVTSTTTATVTGTVSWESPIQSQKQFQTLATSPMPQNFPVPLHSQYTLSTMQFPCYKWSLNTAQSPVQSQRRRPLVTVQFPGGH